jgi:hypothetical protein
MVLEVVVQAEAVADLVLQVKETTVEVEQVMVRLAVAAEEEALQETIQFMMGGGAEWHLEQAVLV